MISKSPEQTSARSARVSALDRLSSVNPDLREFLTNKQKLELFQTSPSCCEQVGCQLVTVHSVHCRLRPVLAILPNRQSVFNRLSVRAPAKHHKRSISRNLSNLPSASVNMIGREREPHKVRRASCGANSPSFSSLDLDYSPV